MMTIISLVQEVINIVLLILLSIVYYGISRLYTSVTITMVIYHTCTSCPAGPRYAKSHCHLHLGV